MTPDQGTPRLHVSARVERRLQAAVTGRLRRRGWVPTVVPVTGYGADGWTRVLARVVLRSPGSTPAEVRDGRGWRRFLGTAAPGVSVTVELGERTHVVVSDDGGYVDARLESDLPPGWHTARLATSSISPVEVQVRTVGAETAVGVVSDIDDTVMVTMLPRPLVALRNAFLVRESARQPVPGMADLYREIVDAVPDVFVVYLSTGAWNTAPALGGFLRRHGYPQGPLLLTDWGPTPTGWFRSGREHKREQLRRLIDELPHVSWLLVGDDGQHDPSLYAEAAAAHPERVLGVAIRQLSGTEQLATHGTSAPKDGDVLSAGVLPEGAVCAPDGFELARLLRARGVILRRED
ncbi:App1 family protein [Nocardioides sp. LHG3406-4]|uniref:App1 family protein n=1 Tax=Nocardioides sp. LHG3406-4 TaxID=2804575 RepID=UPI003CF43BA2